MSPITKDQFLKIGKAALYVGISAILDFLIVTLAGRTDMFGPLTPLINVILVTLKQLFTSQDK